jgi:TATA-box binding protein (TBP) (component of TFIID and TFIIIB)
MNLHKFFPIYIVFSIENRHSIILLFGSGAIFLTDSKHKPELAIPLVRRMAYDLEGVNNSLISTLIVLKNLNSRAETLKDRQRLSRTIG